MKDLTYKYSDGSIPNFIDFDTVSKHNFAGFEALELYHERAIEIFETTLTFVEIKFCCTTF